MSAPNASERKSNMRGQMWHQASQIWNILAFSELQSLGGRFLPVPRFTTAWIFLLLRIWSASIVARVVQSDIYGLNKWFVLFMYVAGHSAIFTIRRVKPADKPYGGLIVIQTVFDVTLVASVAVFDPSSAPIALMLFFIPVSEASLLGPFRFWSFVASIITISCLGVAWNSSLVALLPSSLVVSSMVILRLYRGVHLRDRQINGGSKCGITMLTLEGSVVYWNDTQKSFAPPGADQEKRAGLPCYWIFHREKSPCRWCGLPWKRKPAGDSCPGRRTEDGPYRDQMVLEELEKQFSEGGISCFSNQLKISRNPEFSAADFRDSMCLVSQLRSQSAPPARLLWNLFSSSARKVIEAHDSRPERVQAILIEELNRVIRLSFYETEPFSKVKLSPETLELRSLQPEGEVLAQFNRLLLQDAFPADIRKKEELRIFHIYFGPVYRDSRHGKVITHVVESVTDITDAVLEMPFLRQDRTSAHQPIDPKMTPQGLPPISIVSVNETASRSDPHQKVLDRRVLGLNYAKFERCRLHRSDLHGKNKNDIIGEICFFAYGHAQEDQQDYCRDCPVEAAYNLGRPAKRIVAPGRAMVTAVPLRDPQGRIRAVFEFIDDISALKEVEEIGGHLNDLVNEVDVKKAGLRGLKELSQSDTCVLLELSDDQRTISVWGDEGGPIRRSRVDAELQTKRDSIAPIGKIPVVGRVIQTKVNEYINNVTANADLRTLTDLLMRPRDRKNIDRGKPLSGVLLPILNRDGNVTAIVSLLQFAEQASFDAERLLYCSPLASHWAGALVRAHEFERRERFIRSMKYAAEIIAPEMALQKLIHEAEVLLPEDISLTGYYRKREPGETHKILLVGRSGAKHMADEVQSKREKWALGQQVKTGAKIDTLINTVTPYELWLRSAEEGAEGGRPTLENTRSIFWQGLYFQGDCVGYLVAESPKSDLRQAFPEPERQMISLLCELAAILVGRSAILCECTLHLCGHQLRRPLNKIGKLITQLGLDPAGEITSPNKAGQQPLAKLHTVLAHAKSELDVWATTWQVISKSIETLPNLELISLHRLLADTVSEFKAHEENAAIRIEPFSDNITCFINKKVISSCLHEIINNAWKYRDASKPDPITITILPKPSALAVEILVKNEGQIPLSATDRVFEVFFRLREHSNQGGTGLGLWRVRTLLAVHPGARVDIKKNNPVVLSICLPTTSNQSNAV